ncbi:MAG: DNA polymerase III subunit epsilon [Lactococcus lactis]|nr:DNA polymerase III subunit epsilon [Lactococcus lactis]
MDINLGIDRISFGNLENAKETRKKGKSLISLPDNYIIIDLETTGLDPRFDKIIEIGGLKVENHKIVDEFDQLVNSFENEGVQLPYFITSLTGITDQDILENGVPVKQAIASFIDFIGDHLVLGYNVNFDINFLYDTYLKLFDKKFKNDYVDILRLSRKAYPELKHHRLKDMIKLLPNEREQDHRASSDTKVTKLIYEMVLEKIAKDYGTEPFLDMFKNTTSNESIKAKNILTRLKEFDKENPFFEKYVCFTGKMDFIIRKEAMQIIKDSGGTPQDNVTQKTDYLILGDTSYSANVKDGVTGKMKKAQSSISNGQDLKILTESIFLDMLNEKQWEE